MVWGRPKHSPLVASPPGPRWLAGVGFQLKVALVLQQCAPCPGACRLDHGCSPALAPGRARVRRSATRWYEPAPWALACVLGGPRGGGRVWGRVGARGWGKGPGMRAPPREQYYIN